MTKNNNSEGDRPNSQAGEMDDNNEVALSTIIGGIPENEARRLGLLDGHDNPVKNEGGM